MQFFDNADGEVGDSRYRSCTTGVKQSPRLGQPEHVRRQSFEVYISASHLVLFLFNRSWRIDRPVHFDFTTALLFYSLFTTTRPFIMKYEIFVIALIGAVAAHPAPRATRREVPQEHAHENILRAVNNILMQDNPDEIADAVFGLLGAEAAANGAGDIADAGKFSHDMLGVLTAKIYRLSSTSHSRPGLHQRESYR